MLNIYPECLGTCTFLKKFNVHGILFAEYFSRIFLTLQFLKNKIGISFFLLLSQGLIIYPSEAFEYYVYP